MAELVYEEKLISSEALMIGDEFKIGDLHVQVERRDTNLHDEMVLHLTVLGVTVKKRSKMMLIIPKKLPIITLK